MTKWILLFVIGIMFESTGLVFLKKGMMTEKGMMTVAEVRPLTVSKAPGVVKAAATNGQILLGVFTILVLSRDSVQELYAGVTKPL